MQCPTRSGRQFLAAETAPDLVSLTPFIVTAGAQHREKALEAIEYGALDLIVTPLIPHEAVSTVQLARKLHELRKIIASRHQRMKGLREDQVRHDVAARTATKFVSETIQAIDQKYESRRHVLRAYERTIPALDASVALLAKQATALEHRAGEGRSKRLAALLDLARRGGEFY